MWNIKNLLKNIKECPKEFPVETALGLTFFGAGICLDANFIESFFPFWFVVLFFVTTITLRNINKSAYYLSYLLVWAVYFLFDNGKTNGYIAEERWFWVLNIVAAVVLTADLKKSDNKDFLTTTFSRIGEVIAAGFLSLIVSALVSAILASVMYLFNFHFITHLIAHANIFIFLTIMPLLYCYLRAHNNHENNYDNSKFINIIVDYILSPALVVYTFILGIYILKIVVVQELPRGGVAYMVSIYIALALIANLLNKLVEKSHFNWFYDNFAYIALAPIVLLWIGTIYRINEYGLTEWRIYLLVINALMTIFPFMLKFQTTNRYNLFTGIIMFLMVVLTCIPPVSARNIGIRNQYNRYVRHAMELDVWDTQKWAVRENFDIDKISQDSTLKAQFLKMQDEYYFLRRNCDSIAADNWSINSYDLVDETRSTYFELSEYTDKVSLDGFDNYWVKPYREEISEDVFVITSREKTILEYHFRDTLKAVGDDVYKNPLRVLKYHNDSIMVLFKTCWLYKKDSVYDIDFADYDLFCK
ncbi:MAG: DUF4153 domain-containing protein [Bacteroidales bacterium]|nr:DUF4153 domain-containing protein [Bacteroidales bacterium]